jgi:hypothetical protein
MSSIFSFYQHLQSTQQELSFIQDCVRLIETEVASKKGLSGLALKTAFKAIKKVKPSIIEGVVRLLLPQFATAFDQIYTQYQTSSITPLSTYFNQAQEQITLALLSVTDQRVLKSTNALLVKTYNKLRPLGEAHVKSALPQLAILLQKYLP